MESYLVRIYRRKKGDPQEITGTVEEVITSQIRAFRNLAELDDLFLAPTDQNSSGTKSTPQDSSANKTAEDTQ